MRLPSFRLPKPHVSAIYLSSAPLFDFALARQPLAEGIYRSLAEGTSIVFERSGNHYRVSGDATPETVTLIPIAARADTYVFQQSAGRGTSFYGMLAAEPGQPGFRLFSPESRRDDAIRNAKANGATSVEPGCLFVDSQSLLAALVPLIAAAPPHSWMLYSPT